MDNYYFHMDNLSVGYNRKALIHDICIGIKKGEIVTLIGPNGSGKSTILKVLQDSCRSLAERSILTTRICCPLPFGICLPVWL